MLVVRVSELPSTAQRPVNEREKSQATQEGSWGVRNYRHRDVFHDDRGWLKAAASWNMQRIFLQMQSTSGPDDVTNSNSSSDVPCIHSMHAQNGPYMTREVSHPSSGWLNISALQKRPAMSMHLPVLQSSIDWLYLRAFPN